MPQKFNASLVNDPFGDPGMLVTFLQKKRALLFDMGDISSVPVHEILSISHVFITHTHIDHFYGFDRMLRICLGRSKILRLYGPPGLLNKVEGKLSGYCWNLIRTYKQNFIIQATEIHKNHSLSRNYQSKKSFKSSHEKQCSIENKIILSENDFDITAVTLDHGIECIAFSFQEKPKIEIIPDKIRSMGLLPGKWISHLKQCLKDNVNKKTLIKVPGSCHKTLNFTLQQLSQEITKISSGQKITYITDIGEYNQNQRKIFNLAYKSTHLFIEAVFTTKQKNMANKKYHLTAKQAGRIARISQSKKYTLFHHSKRYIKFPLQLQQEATSAFIKYKNQTEK